MSVARCCCPRGAVEPPPTLVGVISFNWEPGGSRWNTQRNSSNTVFPGHWGGVLDFTVPYISSGGFRSNAANVPQGTTLTSAKIVVERSLSTARGAASGTASCDIRAEAADTATVLSSAAGADAAIRGTAAISNYTHSVGQFNRVRIELDVTVLAQEMVNRPGWTTSSAFQFFLDRTANTTNVSGVIIEEIGDGVNVAEPELELVY